MYIKDEIFKEMPLGYAFHQFLKDENGVPYDYIFLEVNTQIESFISLCASEIIGRKATEVLPWLIEDDFDWIQAYAKVAYEDDKLKFTRFSKPLNKWFRVIAYSPEEGYFVTLVEDISYEKLKEKSDCTDFDSDELTLLMQSAWFIKESNNQIKKIEEERQKLNQILNQLPVLFCEFDIESKLNYVNKCYGDYFGLDSQALIGKYFLDFILEEEKDSVRKRYTGLTPENPVIQYTHQVKKDKEIRWMEWQDLAIFNDERQLLTYYSIGMDITDRKLLETKVNEELTQLKAALENHRAIMFFIEPENGEIIYANSEATNYYGYSKEELLKMSIQEINMLGKDKVRDLRNMAAKASQQFFTVPHRLKNGEIRMVDVFSSLIDYDRKKVLFSIIFDVTDKENAMKEIKSLAYHDHLTGVYNRRYFEEIYTKLNKAGKQPLAIILGDINGLKMVNDSYGHTIGDKLIIEAAKHIHQFFPEDAILARIGGDEFVVLITEATEEDVAQITDLLEEDLEKYICIGDNGNSNLYLSVSFGYGIQNKDRQSMDDLIKQAERQVYRRKYYNDRSMRSHMIRAMMSTLFQKSEREKKHSERVGAYCEAIARALNWDLERINKNKVAGNLHDISKIGIDGSILNKPGELNDEEWEIMRQHPNKSAKILEEIEEYQDIAEIVAAHHEKWDGTGYPKGLKGDEIPAEARIIAVADAYDAMTHYRTYRKLVSKEAAIAELYRCAGIQFDPAIVDVFVEVLMKENPTRI